MASTEELSRPGDNYLIGKNGDPTYHGKTFAPEEVKPGGAHVTVLPDGTVRVNSGTLSDSAFEKLRQARKLAGKKPDLKRE